MRSQFQYGKLLTLWISIAAFYLVLAGCASVKRPEIDIPAVAPKPPPIKNVDVAVVLGAGGSRGLAHIGVLEVLQKEGIPIDLIVGSSAGSIMGALYADSLDTNIVKSKVMHLKKKDLLDPSLAAVLKLDSPVQGNALEQFLVSELQAKDFGELKIPLVVVATNVNNNHITMLRSGPIAPAVHASSALPPLFTPVTLYQQTLVDGAVIAPVPVAVARLFRPKVIIAVDISAPPSSGPCANVFELFYRSLHISFYELSRSQSAHAEVTIHPDLAGFGTFEDQYNNHFYEKGKQATEEATCQIKALLKRKGIKLKPKKR